MTSVSFSDYAAPPSMFPSHSMSPWATRPETRRMQDRPQHQVSANNASYVDVQAAAIMTGHRVAGGQALLQHIGAPQVAVMREPALQCQGLFVRVPATWHDGSPNKGQAL